MQAYANSQKWNVPTRFTGFENNQIVNSNDWIYGCMNGYIEEKSPMGYKVCEGSIAYVTQGDDWGMYKRGLSWKGKSCRYR